MQLPLPIEGEIVEIMLTQGKSTIVDAIDGDLILRRWSSHSWGYAQSHTVTSNGKQGKLLLHRVILERILNRPMQKGEIADHINGDRLDNRRSNLRIATDTESARNRGRRSDNTSGYKGVVWSKGMKKKWAAQVYANRKRVYIEYFDTPEEAHEAYCKAAKEIYGEFARFE